MPTAASRKVAQRDPFLVPLCDDCGGAMNLSSVEPHPTTAGHDVKTFACTRCGAQQTFDVLRRVVKKVERE